MSILMPRTISSFTLVATLLLVTATISANAIPANSEIRYDSGPQKVFGIADTINQRTHERMDDTSRYFSNFASRNEKRTLITNTGGGKHQMVSFPETLVRRAHEEALQRHRRDAVSGQCQRHQLYVKFKDIEWNHVIQPEGYQAYYCAGKCQYPFTEAHADPLNHAAVQGYVHSKNSSVPSPCCIPTKLSSISTISLDAEKKPFTRVLENMAVDECGCR